MDVNRCIERHLKSIDVEQSISNASIRFASMIAEKEKTTKSEDPAVAAENERYIKQE